MDYFNNIPNYNIPTYYNNMYYSNNKNIKQINQDRFIPGGFILPFALGFATAPLILPPARPKPYQYQVQYPPYYYNYNYQVYK